MAGTKSPICTSSECVTCLCVCVRVWQEMGAFPPFIFHMLSKRSAPTPHTSLHQSASKTSFLPTSFQDLFFPDFLWRCPLNLPFAAFFSFDLIYTGSSPCLADSNQLCVDSSLPFLSKMMHFIIYFCHKQAKLLVSSLSSASVLSLGGSNTLISRDVRVISHLYVLTLFCSLLFQVFEFPLPSLVWSCLSSFCRCCFRWNWYVGAPLAVWYLPQR